MAITDVCNVVTRIAINKTRNNYLKRCYHLINKIIIKFNKLLTVKV